MSSTTNAPAITGTIPVADYPVMESFSTVQGEGAYTGLAAHFIRLGGCDVGCTWCDVKDSWDAGKHPHRTIKDLVAEAAAHPARIAVVTGGEPLMYQLGPLTDALRAAGFRTHLETSGAYPLSGQWHHICLSPKKFKAALPEVFAAANELKVIVFNRHDFHWAEEQAGNVGAGCRLFLQPEWDKRDSMMPLIVDHVKQHPHWSISIQTHKYLNIP
ncbi:MAG: 7-carboxy-7-deazaguanine synthase QueE [Flavobacteriales bacterium]